MRPAAELRAAPRDAATSRGAAAAGAIPAERGGAVYAETDALFSPTCLLQTRVKTRRLKSVIDAYEPLMSRPHVPPRPHGVEEKLWASRVCIQNPCSSNWFLRLQLKYGATSLKFGFHQFQFASL